MHAKLLAKHKQAEELARLQDGSLPVLSSNNNSDLKRGPSPFFCLGEAFRKDQLLPRI
jgi:hypothetical protein